MISMYRQEILDRCPEIEESELRRLEADPAGMVTGNTECFGRVVIEYDDYLDMFSVRRFSSGS